MLQLILGRAGSGKTQHLFERMAARAKKGQGKSLLLVPEQYTLESERALLRTFGNPIGQTVEVCSFTRLCHRILEQTGGLAGLRLKKGASVLLMAQAVEDVSAGLKVYQKASLRPELITRLINLYDELRAYRVSLADMERVGAALPQNRRSAVAECCAILEAYRTRLLEAGGLEDSLELACKGLDQNSLFADTVLFIDGFKSFTPQELEILKRLFEQSRQIFASLCCEEPFDRYAGRGLFSSASKTAGILNEMAGALSFKVTQPIILKETHRFLNPELGFLEKNLFDYSAPAFEGECRAITINRAKSQHEEVERAAQEICTLVREEGFQYRDIVIVARDIEDYSGILHAVFKRYDIPIFLDRREELSVKPLVALALSALSAVNDGFEFRSVMGCVKTGLMGVDRLEADYLENYALMWGIRGGAWQREWTRSPDGYTCEITREGVALLARVNQTRAAVIEPLLKLAKARNTDAQTITRALYEFLTDVDIPTVIQKQASELEGLGETRASREGLRLWEIFIDALEQAALALKGQPCTMKKYADLLRLLIAEYDIGHIPPCIDQVLAGAANRIRAHEGRAVFLLGVNDGVFPAVPSQKSLLSDDDRQVLTDGGLFLSAGAAQEAFGEQILFYSAVTSVRKRVYLSYIYGEKANRPLRPSMIVGRIKSLFPELREREECEPLSKVQSLDSAFELAALGSSTPEGAALSDYFSNITEYQKTLQDISGRLKASKQEQIDERGNLLGLYGRNMRVSPSRAEKFYECGFAYLCRYGLGLSQRRRAEFAAPETGTMVHYVLEKFVCAYAEQIKKAEPLTAEQAQVLTARIAGEYLDSLSDAQTSKRLRHQWERITKATLAIVENLRKELSQSRFVPVDFELVFSENQANAAKPVILPLSSGGSVTVTGVVDRVDLYHNGDRAYLRVVDYKTGSKKFSLLDLYHGLSMQMLIYLFALCRNSQDRYGKKALPGGILYLPAASPVLKLKRNVSEEKVQAELAKALRSNGLLLGEDAVLEAMEEELGGSFIPVSVKSNGRMSGKESLADLELFALLERFVESRIRGMGERVLAGYAEASPLKGLGKDACRWCEMKQICRFEEGRSMARRIKKLSREESIEKIKREVGE